MSSCEIYVTQIFFCFPNFSELFGLKCLAYGRQRSPRVVLASLTFQSTILQTKISRENRQPWQNALSCNDESGHEALALDNESTIQLYDHTAGFDVHRRSYIHSNFNPKFGHEKEVLGT